MPNRILKESICTSDSIDGLTLFEEVFFYRLIVNCDDYGRMDGRPKVLRAKLFPLRDVNYDDVVLAMRSLESAGLIMMYEADQKPYIQLKSWDKHQQVRAKKSKFPAPDSSCNQLISDDCNSPRNPIQSESESESESVSVSESEPLLDAGEAHEIQKAQDRILSMAENAGFAKSPMVRAKLVDLFAQHGEVKLAEAIGECVVHGVTNLAYLEAVLRGGGKKKGKTVNAQQYEQRDYQNIQDEFERAQAERVMARLREEGKG